MQHQVGYDAAADVSRAQHADLFELHGYDAFRRVTLRRRCPRNAAAAALPAPSRPPEAARNLAANRLTVGHSNRLTIDRCCFSSRLIAAITCTARRDVPPTSKKLSWIPMRRPNTLLQMFNSAACSVLDGATSTGASSGCFRSRYASMAFATRSMSYRCSPITCRRSDRSPTPNPQTCRGGRGARGGGAGAPGPGGAGWAGEIGRA